MLGFVSPDLHGSPVWRGIKRTSVTHQLGRASARLVRHLIVGGWHHTEVKYVGLRALVNREWA